MPIAAYAERPISTSDRLRVLDSHTAIPAKTIIAPRETHRTCRSERPPRSGWTTLRPKMEDATSRRIDPGTSARRQTVPASRPAVHDGYTSETSWRSTAFGFPPSGRVPASRAAKPSKMMKKYERE